MSLTTATLALPTPTIDTTQRVELRCFSYEDRFFILSATLEALQQCGCWMESRHPISATQMELCFVAQLSCADELYGGLIAAGVEMTRDSHLAMTWLCTLRRHKKEAALSFATVNVRMQINFMDDADMETGFAAAGLA